MNQLHHNAPDLAGLTALERQLVELGATAVESLKRTFEQWMDIGHGLKILRGRANQIKGRNAFRLLAEQAGYGLVFHGVNNKIIHSVASNLLDIVEHEPQVRTWRDGLTDEQRWAWSSPSSIKRWCPIFATKKPRPKKAKPSKFDAAIAIFHDHLKKTKDAGFRQDAIEQIITPFGDETAAVWTAALRLKPVPVRIAVIKDMMAELKLKVTDLQEDPIQQTEEAN
jgi:hypothetical protein